MSLERYRKEAAPSPARRAWPNGILVLSAAALLVFGVLFIRSACSIRVGPVHDLWKKMLFVWIPLGTAAHVAVASVDHRRWTEWAWVLYLGALALLVLVLVPGIGTMSNVHARRWLFGVFQPAEAAPAPDPQAAKKAAERAAREAEKARKAEEKAAQKAERDRIAAEKRAEKEAKWAEQDRKYEEKQEAKRQKALEKERKKKLRILKNLEKKAQKERRIFERYLEQERVRAEKKAAREAEKAARAAEKADREAEKAARAAEKQDSENPS